MPDETVYGSVTDSRSRMDANRLTWITKMQVVPGGEPR